MTLPYGYVPTQEDLDLALDEAVNEGTIRTDTGFSDDLGALIERVATSRVVTTEDEQEAYRLLDVQSTEADLADAESAD